MCQVKPPFKRKFINKFYCTHCTSDIIKVDFLWSQNFSFEIVCKKKCQSITKNHLLCVKDEGEKNVKEVKMHKLLVCTCNSQDFAQNQTNFARSHDNETVTFQNSTVHIFKKII